MQLILSEADSCRPQREERDLLEHWEDDGGASGQEQSPNGRRDLPTSGRQRASRGHSHDRHDAGLFAIPVNDRNQAINIPKNDR
jgi:hypothetical protein